MICNMRVTGKEGKHVEYCCSEENSIHLQNMNNDSMKEKLLKSGFNSELSSLTEGNRTGLSQGQRQNNTPVPQSDKANSFKCKHWP